MELVGLMVFDNGVTISIASPFLDGFTLSQEPYPVVIIEHNVICLFHFQWSGRLNESEIEGIDVRVKLIEYIGSSDKEDFLIRVSRLYCF